MGSARLIPPGMGCLLLCLVRVDLPPTSGWGPLLQAAKSN